MSSVNLDAPEFHPSREEPRAQMRRAARREEPKPPTADDLEEVMIVCITDLQPWTHEDKRLQKGDKAIVPRWLANTMVENEHAVII